MIKAKHLLDAVEAEDGFRIWMEPIGLTRDLCEWCDVTFRWPHLGPPMELWDWFQEHPDGYEYFRGAYHEYLAQCPFLSAVGHIARNSGNQNYTLLHQGDDPAQNSAVALYEFLSELASYCPPD
jgi:uncharacterized protein YeaO (DUF488 family)